MSLQIAVRIIKTFSNIPIYLVMYEECKQEMYEELLTANEIAYLEDMSETKRVNSLIGRVAAKYAIANYIKNRDAVILDFSQIDVISGGEKQPVCVYRGISKEIITPLISIAHCSSCAVAIAVDKNISHGVGIDIEQIREWRKETIIGFLNPDEEAYCALRTDNYMKRVTLLWCLKEAYLKAVGTGIRTHPRSVTIHMDSDDVRTVTIEVRGRAISAQITWTQEADGYIITSVIL